jgi:hypothetical protein
LLKIQEQNKLNSIRGKKCLNDNSESFLPVSKREKEEDLDVSKRVIFCLATAAAAAAAAAVNGGVFLKSGHKKNIEGAEQKMNEAENSLLLVNSNN